MNRRISLGLRLVAYLGLVLLTSAVLANGGKAKKYVYKAELPLGNKSCKLEVEVNPVLFRLTTLNNKYHVLLIQSRNETGVPLKLSPADKVEILLGGKRVQGILNLASSDVATWDGLAKHMREAVAYPAQVDANEEEGLYVYVPTESLKDVLEDEVPKSIVFTVQSLNRSVTLRRPESATKK